MKLNFLVPFAQWLRDRVVEDRDPDFVIGDPATPYMRRWWVVPRNKFFNVYLHHFLHSDDDRALHDHPWLFNVSFLIQGCYREHTIADGGIHSKTLFTQGALRFRGQHASHRVELINTYASSKALLENTPSPKPCWTLFVTGPVVREWGFHCPRVGWVHWKDFCKEGEPGQKGRGCGEEEFQ